MAQTVTWLQLLIRTWRCFSQLLLYDVQSTVSEENKKCSLSQLMGHCRLDNKMPPYNRNEGVGVSFIIFSPNVFEKDNLKDTYKFEKEDINH